MISYSCVAHRSKNNWRCQASQAGKTVRKEKKNSIKEKEKVWERGAHDLSVERSRPTSGSVLSEETA